MLQERLTVIYRTTIQPSGTVSWHMMAFEGVLYGIALNTGIPYIRPAMAFSENQLLGRFLGASVYIAIGSVCIRTLANFIAYWRTVQPSFSHGKVEWGLMFSAICLGMVAAVPGACVTLKYNSRWVLPLSLFYDITTCTASYNALFRQLYHDRWVYHGKRPLLEKRNLFLLQLQLGLYTGPWDDSIEPLLSTLQQARAIAIPKMLIRSKHPWVYQHGLRLNQILFGIGLPLAWEIICLYLVYQDMKSVLGIGNVLSGILACVTTFPAFFLEYQFAKSIVGAVYLFVMDSIYRIQTPHPLWMNHPRKTCVGIGLATVLMGGSFTSRAQIIMDLLNATNQREILLIAVCIGTVIFKLSAALQNVLAIGLALCTRYDTDPLYRRYRLFQQHQMLVSTATPAEILEFDTNALAQGSHRTQHTEIETLLDIQPDPSQVSHESRSSGCWFFRDGPASPSNRHAVNAVEPSAGIEMNAVSGYR